MPVTLPSTWADGQAGGTPLSAARLNQYNAAIQTLSDELDRRGERGYAQVTADQGGITAVTDLTGLTLTFTVVANRKLRLIAQALFRSTVSGDIAKLSITDSAGNVLQFGQLAVTGANATLNVALRITPAAGTVTYKLRAERAAGTGTLTMEADAISPAFLLVEDIGPV